MPTQVTTTSVRGRLAHAVEEARPSAAPRLGTGTPPPSQGDQRQHGKQIGELQPEREAEADLPGGDEPAGEHKPTRGAPVAAQQQEQRQGNAAAGDHVQVAGLGHAIGGVGERGPGDGRADPSGAQLAREQPGADEAQRPSRKEEQVVADERRDGTRSEEGRRPVAEQRVREGKAQAGGDRRRWSRTGAEGRAASRVPPTRSPKRCAQDRRDRARCGWTCAAPVARWSGSRARSRRGSPTKARRD